MRILLVELDNGMNIIFLCLELVISILSECIADVFPNITPVTNNTHTEFSRASMMDVNIKKIKVPSV